jgi:peptide/nickel transport system permease protein
MSVQRPEQEEGTAISDPIDVRSREAEAAGQLGPLDEPQEVLGDPGMPIPAIDPIGRMVARRKPRRKGNVFLWFGIIWLGLMTFFALTAPYLPLRGYGEIGSEIKLRPGFRWHEPLGTDNLGRSEISRVINGARVSMGVGLGAVLLGMAVGIALGVTAGYFRGKIDTVISILMDALLAFPPLVLLLALASVLKPSLKNLILALGFLVIPTFGRIARANTLVIARREFVLAAKVMGATHWRLLIREVVPNVLLPVSSYAFIVVASLIVAEGSLSFLGLGVPPPQPSWGGMIAAGQPNLATDPHLVFVPALFLFLTVFSFNAVGDRVRARFDTRASSL